MFSRIILAVAFLMNSFSPSYSADFTGGQYFFRYKAGSAVSTNEPGGVSKDITAFYIGGLNTPFSEKLPMKPEWQDDRWVVTKGYLPAGLSFDSRTLTFSGTPQDVVSDVTVELSGFDQQNNEVADAVAHFNIYQLPDSVVDVNLYGHTGKYLSHGLDLPAGVTIEGDPELLNPLPPGIRFNARYFDGTPTQAGNYHMLAIGRDFLGNDVVAFKVRLIVQDGPTFDYVADDLRQVQVNSTFGCVYGRECAAWHAQPIPPVQYAIKDVSKVRYYTEVESGSLPGTLAFSNNVYDRQLSGIVSGYYDQARVRYRAVDTDGTTGYSNWFKLGTLGPVGTCEPPPGADKIALFGSVGDDFIGNGYKIPSGLDSGEKNFSLVSGKLPSGLSLNQSTGFISGKPTSEEISDDIRVQITFPGAPGSTPVTCGPYQIKVAPAAIALTKGKFEKQYRVGSTVDISLKASGGLIAPYSVTLDPGSNLPGGVTFQTISSDTYKVSGVVTEAGAFSATARLLNGDGRPVAVGISFSGHDALTIDDVPAISEIPQYDVSENLFSVAYAQDKVIGEPRLSLLGGNLPAGFYFDGMTLTMAGGTRLPPQDYGPFNFRLSDETGQFVDGNPFHLRVTQRADLVANSTVNPVFHTNRINEGKKPFSVVQPPLAQGYLPLRYRLSGPDLPRGLSFDENSGMIAGTAKDKVTLSGFTVTIDELSSDNLFKVSDAFEVVVDDPPPLPPIQDVSLGRLEGNVSGPGIISAEPTPYLAKIRDTLVGYEESVVFNGSDLDVPGLAFSETTGRVEGNPSVEFSGVVAINYHDGASRPGKLQLPVTIYPYPAVSTDQDTYEVPRLAEARNYGVMATPSNSGFYKGVKWKLHSTSESLPPGLELTQYGNRAQIVGKTAVSEGRTYKIVLSATSLANGIEVLQPLTLRIAKPLNFNMEIPEVTVRHEINPDTGANVRTDTFSPKDFLKGSWAEPLEWSLKHQPSWLSVVKANGQLVFTNPSLGEATATLIATDREGRQATGEIKAFITYSGFVAISPGSNGVVPIVVRNGETFATPPQTVSRVVKPFRFVSSSAPSTLVLDQVTGVFRGYLETDGFSKWQMQIKDAHGRELAGNNNYLVQVIPALSISDPRKNDPSRQYDPARPVLVKFEAAENAIGNVSYTLEGNLPGTLYYKVKEDSGLVFYLRHLPNGGVDVTMQAEGENIADTERRLAHDRLIFDPETLTLSGVPSEAGDFSISLVAFDDHAMKYIDPTDPTRLTHNKAVAGPFTLSVEPALDLVIANSKQAEALHQFTSQPSIRTTVSNTAYGLGIKTWQPIGSALPKNVKGNGTAQGLTYSGYPEVQGTFPNIVWKAIDFAGREITSDAISFSVGERQPMELVSSKANLRHMIVFDTDADLTVTPRYNAYGRAIGVDNWTVTGAENLPDGVTVKVTDGNVKFSGKPNILGTYSGIKVTGTDSLGSRASIDLVFRVISDPEAIVLNVSNITTKVGYPVLMEPPFALGELSTDNTYGKLRFYSYDLANVTAINLSSDTGKVTGSFDRTGRTEFDVYVTDETNRITSKPVVVDVIPNLRLLIPSMVSARQGSNLSRPIATDYTLGAVSYRKGAGDWPANLEVNPSTGEITGKTFAATGTYSGLTIVGTDTFGAYTDVQSSNSFSIVVDPIDADPLISNIPGNKLLLGEVGQPVSFTPTVVDSVNKQPWNFKGTVYSLNKPLPRGLTFDAATGTISGIALEPVIETAMVISVTSERGDVAGTAPFWFGVQPTGPITVADSKKLFDVRPDAVVKTDTPVYSNAFGALKFSFASAAYGLSLGVDGTLNGKVTGCATLCTVTVKATDDFNRSLSVDYKFNQLGALVVSMAPIQTFVDEVMVAATPTVGGVYGTRTFSYTGLPNGLTFNAQTGVLTGTPAMSGADAIENHTATVTVTDSYDQRSQSNSFVITLKKASGHLHWRLQTLVAGDTHITPMEIIPRDETGASLASLIVRKPIPYLFDGDGGGFQRLERAQIIEWSFSEKKDVSSIVVHQYARFSYYTMNQIRVWWSDDGTTWNEYWTSPVANNRDKYVITFSR